MKKNIIIISILCLFSINVKSQKKHINNDTLYAWFKQMSPFEIFEKLRQNISCTIDYKAITEDTTLKPYILKWVDRKEYYIYEYNKKNENLKNLKDDIKDIYVKSYLYSKKYKEKELNYIFDSIKKIPELYEKYKDTAFIFELNSYEKGYPNKEYNIPSEIYSKVSNIKYPELYLAFKKQWEFRNKCFECSEFYNLLNYCDSQAMHLSDSLIDIIVKTNGETSFFRLLFLYPQNWYYYTTVLKLLSVDKKVYITGDERANYNIQLYKDLLYDYQIMKYIDEKTKIKKVNYKDEKLKIQPEVIEAVKKAIEEMKKEDEKWMKNMPYYWSK